jgi:hypothetical protein
MTQYSASGGHAGGRAGGGGPGKAGRQSGFFANEGETWVRDASPVGETSETDGDGQIRAPARSFPLAYSLTSFLPFLPFFPSPFLAAQRAKSISHVNSRSLALWAYAQNFQPDFDADGSHEVRAYRALFGSFLVPVLID